MNRLHKQKVKKAKLNEYLFPLEIQEKRVNDTYIYIPIKEKRHVSQTKKLITKTIQKHFKERENDQFAMQKKRSEKYLSMKSTFDNYMLLTPAERRKMNISNMRGYQYDKNAKLLYSFEDSCVYKVTEDPIMNKIVIIRKENIPFTDIQKRAVFDSPTKYKPISPYRLKWPSTPLDVAGNEIVVRMDDQFNNLSSSLENATESFNQASANINNLAQQFNNIIAPQQNVNIPEEEDDEDTRKTNGMILYREDRLRPIHPYNDDDVKKCKYGSKTYRDLLAKGYKHEYNYLYDPNTVEKQQIVATQNVNQQIALPDELIERLDELIVTIDQNTFVNSLGNVMNTIVQVEKQTGKKCEKLRNSIYEKLDLLEDYYKEFATSYLAIQDKNENEEKEMSVIVNAIKSLATSVNDHFDAFAKKLETLNLEVKIPPVKIEQSGQITFDKILEEFSKKYQSIIDQHQAFYKDLLTNIKTEIQNYENTQLTTITNKLEDVICHITENQAIFNASITNITNTITNETLTIRNTIADENNATRTLMNDNVMSIADEVNNNSSVLGNIIQNEHENTRQSNYDNAVNLAHVINQGNEHINSNMIGGINYLTRMMMDQQRFTQQLITDGFENLNNFSEQIFITYRTLLNRPIINMFIQNYIPKPLIEGINYISALTPAYNSLELPNVDNSIFNNPEQIQQDVYIFAEFLQPRVNDVGFKNFARETGFTGLFNAFRIRGYDPIFNNFFMNMKNPSHNFTEEELQEIINRIKALNLTNTYEMYNKQIEGLCNYIGMIEDIPDADTAIIPYSSS